MHRALSGVSMTNAMTNANAYVTAHLKGACATEMFMAAARSSDLLFNVMRYYISLYLGDD